MVKIPRVKHFLCCISLRTGILSLCYIGVALNIMTLLTIVIRIANGDDDDPRGGSGDDVDELFERMGRRHTAKQIPTVLANLVLVGLLIYGVVKRRPGYFIPWMAVTGFGMIIFTIAMVAVPFLLAFLIPNMPGVCVAIFAVLLLIYLFMGHYFLVVFSYYKQLKGENRLEQVQNEMETENKNAEAPDLPPSYSDIMDEKVAV